MRVRPSGVDAGSDAMADSGGSTASDGGDAGIASDAGLDAATEAGVGDSGTPDAAKPSPRTDVFVARLDTGGVCKWGNVFEADGAQAAMGVAVNGAGEIVLGGELSDSMDLGGGPLVGPPDPDPAGTLPLSGGGSLFVAKLDKDGRYIWGHVFGGSTRGTNQYRDFNGLALAADGSLAVAASVDGVIDFGTGPLPNGSSTPTVDVFALEPSGATRFARSFPRRTSAGLGIGVDSAANVYLTGGFDPFNDNFTDFVDGGIPHRFEDPDEGVYLASLDRAGAVRGIRLYRGCSGQGSYGDAVSVAANGDVIFAARFDVTNPAGPLIGTFVMAAVGGF
jgi:hypothetical protein